MKHKAMVISIILRLSVAGFFVSGSLIHWAAVFRSLPEHGSFAIIPAILFTLASILFIGEEIQ